MQQIFNSLNEKQVHLSYFLYKFVLVFNNWQNYIYAEKIDSKWIYDFLSASVWFVCHVAGSCNTFLGERVCTWRSLRSASSVYPKLRACHGNFWCFRRQLSGGDKLLVCTGLMETGFMMWLFAQIIALWGSTCVGYYFVAFPYSPRQIILYCQRPR